MVGILNAEETLFDLVIDEAIILHNNAVLLLINRAKEGMLKGKTVRYYHGFSSDDMLHSSVIQYLNKHGAKVERKL